MQPEDLKRKPVLSLKRPRRVTAAAGSGPVPEPPPLPVEDAAETFQLLEDTLVKANTLMDLVKRALVTRTVPVRPEDAEVLAAVRRKDPPSEGRYITFDLYLRAIAFEADALTVEPGEVRGLLTGHRVTDAQHLKALSLRKATGLSKEDSRLLGSQAMYLYILQLMQMGFQALEAEKQTATKEPPGTETPAVSASIVFALAFQLAFSSNLKEDLEAILGESARNATYPSKVDLDRAFAEARKFELPDLRALTLALKTKEPEDFELIREYARAYVRKTRKLGYEPWLLADEVALMQRNLALSLRERSRYQPTSEGGRGVTFPADLSRVLRVRAGRYSRALDLIATSLETTDPATASICSLEWLLRLAEPALSLLHAAIEFVIASKELFLAVEFPKIDLSLDGSILTAILYDLLEMAMKVSERLLCWFQRDPEIWAILEQCHPIAEMVDCALLGIEELERKVFRLLDQTIDHDRHILYSVEIKSKIALEMKKARMMVAKLEYVTSAARQARDFYADPGIRFDPEAEIFGNATRIGAVLKDKAESTTDFVRQEFKSEFLRNVNETFDGMSIPVADAMVPFECLSGDGRSFHKEFEGLGADIARSTGAIDLTGRVEAEADRLRRQVSS